MGFLDIEAEAFDLTGEVGFVLGGGGEAGGEAEFGAGGK